MLKPIRTNVTLAALTLALSADGLLERLISLPFGAIRLTEEFLGPGTRRSGRRNIRGASR